MLNLNYYIEDLISRIDPVQEQMIQDQWVTFGQGKNTEAPFEPKWRVPAVSKVDWPWVAINDALFDPDLMIYYMLRQCHAALEVGAAHVLYALPNYGVGALASMLGAEPYIMPREVECLPNSKAVGEEGVIRLLDTTLNLWETGFGPDIMRTTEKFVRFQEEYPLLKEFVRLEPPDFQSPLDNAELLWGSDIFYALYDDPDLVHALLKMLTQVQMEVLDRWFQMVPETYGIITRRQLVPGRIVLPIDSGMNLSSEMCDEFLIPYLAPLLEKYGGIVHFCGRGDHYIASLSKLKGVNGICLTQPQYNNMDIIFENTIDKGIVMEISRHSVDLTGHKGGNLCRSRYWLDYPSPVSPVLPIPPLK